MELAIDSLCWRPGGRAVLNGVSLTIDTTEDGWLVGIVGPNGSGKSSLLAGIAGLLDGQEGNVRWRGNVGRPLLVPQSPFFAPHLSPIANLTLLKDVGQFRKNWSEARHRQAVAALKPPTVGHVQLFSGGERQRVALVRALSVATDVLLLDEPSGSLDPSGREALLHFLRHSTTERDCLYLIATHQVADLEAMDSIIVLPDSAPNDGLCGQLRTMPTETIFSVPPSLHVLDLIAQGRWVVFPVAIRDGRAYGSSGWTCEAIAAGGRVLEGPHRMAVRRDSLRFTLDKEGEFVVARTTSRVSVLHSAKQSGTLAIVVDTESVVESLPAGAAVGARLQPVLLAEGLIYRDSDGSFVGHGRGWRGRA